MKKLVAYQTDDALELQFPSPIADLVISSPPLDILSNRIDELFKWTERCLSLEGVAIFDCPAVYHQHNYEMNRYTIDLIEKRVDCSLESQFCIPFYDFYHKGDVQSFYFFSRIKLDAVTSIPYRRCEDREMAHPCEFDRALIKNLIEMFTEPHQMVLDPFCGTGMVPITAYELERDGIGIDRRSPFTNLLP